MREWAVEIALVLSIAIGAPVIMLFTTGVQEAWMFVNKAAYETGACWEDRTHDAMLRALGDDGLSKMESFVFDRASEHVSSGESWPVAAFIRRQWLAIILSKDEVAGAYCQLGPGRGRGHNLPDLARIVGVTSVTIAPEKELAALAYVYVQQLQSPRTPEELVRMYRERLAAGGGG